MGILNKDGGLRGSWPMVTVESMMVSGARALMHMTIGRQLDAAEIRRRQMELPLHNARIGKVALDQGTKTGDEQLRVYGEAMIAKALADAENAAAATGEHAIVADGVAAIATSLQPESVSTNPSIAPSVAERIYTIRHGGDGLRQL